MTGLGMKYMCAGLICSLLYANNMQAQGCSDAGFCTAGVLQSAAPDVDSNKLYKNSIGLSYAIGSGEQGTSVFVPQLEWRQSIGQRGFVELKLPYYIAAGNLGGHSGWGDPVITYTRGLQQKKNWSLQATGGLRISIGNADATGKDGWPLPMPYQANLGTTDIILGLSLNYTRFVTIAAGYQQPVVQYNYNGYVPVDAGPAAPHYGDYFLSARLKRKGDVLLRAEGHYQWRQLSISAGPLLIYHLGKDRADILGAEIRLDGSEGFTLNLAGNIAWTRQRWKVYVSAGTPLAVRSYRPDGLTREWVVTPGISYYIR